MVHRKVIEFPSGNLEKLTLRVHAAYAPYDQDVAQDDIVYGRFYVTYAFSIFS